MKNAWGKKMIWQLILGLLSSLTALTALSGGGGSSSDSADKTNAHNVSGDVKPNPSPGPDITPVSPAPEGPDDPEDTNQGEDTNSGGGSEPDPDPDYGDVTPPDGGPVQPGTNAGPDTPAPLPTSAGRVEVMAGRVSTLAPEDVGDISSLRIVSGPAHGNVTVNPDNTFALVLTTIDKTGPSSFSYEATYNDGSSAVFKADLNVVASVQKGGWGTGEHFYMLQTDENDDVIVEHGDNHRKVFVSNSDDALSLKDIAALEGIKVDDIDDKWMKANGADYGADESMALKPDAGMMLWYSVSDRSVEPSSNWLLFERGYEYDDLGRIVGRGAMGESELHPQLITSYGSGDKPVIHSTFSVSQSEAANIVAKDLEFTGGFKALLGENLLADGVSVTDGGISIQNVDGFTFRNSDVVDVVREEPENDGATWDPSNNRVSGIFVKNTHGLLIENTFWDHNGWEDGYDYDMSVEQGQPPSFYSHNVYLQYDNSDVTFRDNITMRGASFGVQVRSGGFIEDNMILDNNAGLNFLGGDYKDKGPIGDYTLADGNVITSGQHLTVASKQGATALGIENSGQLSTLIDNIVAHVADPNNPTELAAKPIEQSGLKHETDPYYDDTIVYNWIGAKRYDNPEKSQDANVDGLDKTVLDQTTIQLFAAELLGDEDATIADLADFLRAQADGRLDEVVDADLVIAYFQKGFGLDVDIRGEAETLRFVPNDLGDGVRWDNRLNWNTEDLPGTQDGDSVDLGGNWVYYGGTTAIEDLDFGEGGKLYVNHGYLQINDHTAVGKAGAELDIDNAGQVWMDGYTDKDLLEIDVAGGRFANTGLFTGSVDMDVSDNAQVILGTGGADFVLGEGSRLDIFGGNAKVGFDGADGDTGVLLMSDKSTLSFTAEDGKLGMVSEFRSGHFGEGGPDIQSGANLGSGMLELDLSGLGGAVSSYKLLELDEIIGSFGDLDIKGLGGDRDAEIVINYDTDQVLLKLTAAGKGSGATSMTTVGDADNAKLSPDLWEALTNGHGVYSDDDPADIPDDEDDLDEAA